MMSPTNDRCQVVSCSNNHFTFCPHCSCNVCIKCLNEHYSIMETEYKHLIEQANTELNIERCPNIERQKNIFNEIYDREIVRQRHFEIFLADKMDSNGLPSMVNFRPCDCQDLKQRLQEFVERRVKFDELTRNIQHLLADFQRETEDNEPENQVPQESKDRENVGSSPDNASLSTWSQFDIQYEIDHKQPTTTMEIEMDEDDCIIEYSTIDSPGEETGDNVSGFSDEMPKTTQSQSIEIIAKNSTNQNGKSVFTFADMETFRSSCPLILHTFGLNEAHCQPTGISHIPCSRLPSETFVLYSHLRIFHLLNHWATIQIIRRVVNANENLFDTDIFSNLPVSSLMGNLTRNVRGHCPLTKMGIFGLLPSHKVKLCHEDSTNNIKLHRHFVNVHNMIPQYATRLCRAIMDKKDRQTPLFGPCETIVRINQ